MTLALRTFFGPVLPAPSDLRAGVGDGDIDTGTGTDGGRRRGRGRAADGGRRRPTAGGSRPGSPRNRSLVRGITAAYA
jgi:hypothetical protein